MIAWMRFAAAFVFVVPAFILACTGVGIPLAMVLCAIGWLLIPNKRRS